ncbi:MAG: hypothetical protein JKY27_07480 [Magnetovibrio sp.]|nr:hypothetical protein [Magnetovibrio sp.]
MRRIWQALMIGLARRDGLTRFIQSWRATSNLAKRYVAGQTTAQATQRALQLRDSTGLRASLFFLGEYVTDPDIIAQTVVRKIEAGAALAAAGLDVHVLVDSTQIGQMIDAATAKKMPPPSPRPGRRDEKPDEQSIVTRSSRGIDV